MQATHYLHTLHNGLHESMPIRMDGDSFELLDGSETHTFGLISHVYSCLKLGNENGTYNAIQFAITASPNSPL